MIFDHIQNAGKYMMLSENIKTAFDFLRETDLNSLEPGRISILDDKVFANIADYATKDPNDLDWEAHQKYIDIQCLIRGQEKIGHGPLNSMKLIKAYDNEKDISFYKGSGDYITLKPGLFSLFFPHDAHKPGLIYMKSILVRKLVIKVLSE